MTNRLAHALSPYLLQHVDNPVQWRQWGAEAKAEAAERDLPLFISVGYAACHWCHVMAHESFEDDEVAAKVNALTVPVKVDREERPDVDAVYMQATLAMTGHGGWPMTVFATPSGEPFFAGTYFPREHFLRLLDGVDEAWTQRREDVIAQGNAVVEACAGSGPKLADVTQSCPIGGPCPPVSPVEDSTLAASAAAVCKAHDPVNGGFGNAPKFPTQPALTWLLDRHAAVGDDAGLAVVRHSAERMARGGICDQLAGGFARYSVDAKWIVPHFEKMLYDNALLLDTYRRLERLGGDQAAFFGRVADGVARFLVDDLGTAEGGFASALDADTGGVEGATYVWTPRQLRAELGDDDGAWAADLFAVTAEGTFEHGASVLQLPRDPDDPQRFDAVVAALLAARSRRAQPDRDDKVVAGWNALAAIALFDYARDRDAAWAASAADRALRLVAEVHLSNGRLRRVSKDGVAGGAEGILEDYAAVASAFVAAYRHHGDVQWLQRAAELVTAILRHFVDDEGAMHDTSADAEQLVNRPCAPTDGPTPSGWALAVQALLDYRDAAGEDDELADDCRDTAWRVVGSAAPVIADYPRFAGGLASAAQRMAV